MQRGARGRRGSTDVSDQEEEEEDARGGGARPGAPACAERSVAPRLLTLVGLRRPRPIILALAFTVDDDVHPPPPLPLFVDAPLRTTLLCLLLRAPAPAERLVCEALSILQSLTFPTLPLPSS